MSKIGAEHYSIRKDVASTDLELIASVIPTQGIVHIDELIPITIANRELLGPGQGEAPTQHPVVGEALVESKK
jgi:hypothetical protein